MPNASTPAVPDAVTVQIPGLTPADIAARRPLCEAILTGTEPEAQRATRELVRMYAAAGYGALARYVGASLLAARMHARSLQSKGGK